MFSTSFVVPPHCACLQMRLARQACLPKLQRRQACLPTRQAQTDVILSAAQRSRNILGISKVSIIILFLSIGAITATAQNPDRGDTRVVVIADMNESYGSTHYDKYVDSTLVWVERWKPDAILTAGDHIAGQSLDLDEENLWAMWEAFDEIITKPIYDLGIPFGVTMGNHDASGSSTFDHEREIAESYWTDHPHHLDMVNDENYPFYYSLTVDDLFIISWDASYSEISEQELNWVVDQLGSSKADEASHRILTGHLPFFAVAEGRNLEGEILRNAHSLFESVRDAGLDIYISGHHHAYYPAKKDGVLLLSAGAIGSGPRPLLDSDLPARRTITIVDFFESDSSYTITTYDIEDGLKKIDPNELPEQIKGINNTITRYDLAPKDQVD